MDQSAPTGAMWPLQRRSLLFEKKGGGGTQTSISVTHPADTNGSKRQIRIGKGLRKERESEGKGRNGGTKGSSPPPATQFISQLAGWSAMNNKTRAEEHLLPTSREEDKGERSHRDPAFDLLI